MTHRSIMLATAALLLVPAGITGQVVWEAPFRMGPGQVGGLGIHLVDAEPGDGFGAMVTWRRSSVPGGLGWRVGLAEGFRRQVAGFGGVDFSGMLVDRSEEFPLDLSWAAGVGAAIDEYALISLPLGLYAGWSLVGDGVRFVPHLGPRLSVDAHFGRKTEEGLNDEQTELSFSLDLGGDIVLGDDLAIRFGASLFDHEALSIGVVFPGVN